MSGHGDAWPRAVLWSGRKSPLGPGYSLSCLLWVWRWRWCADVYGPQIVPALLCAFWSGVPVSAERCLGAAMHKHGRTQSCGRGAEACWVPVAPARVRGVGAGVTMYMAL